jgi:flap endonuclease-1
MGVDLGELVDPQPITFRDLRGRVVAVDAANTLYQFLSIIRQPDGTPLQDSQGRTTSHLSGLLYRTANLAEAGIQPVFVFDGEPPDLKAEEIARRRERKEQAEEERQAALERGDTETAFTKATQTASLTDEMIEGAKTLLDGLGMPWIDAPEEGEAQAAYMVRQADAWGTSSQDYDALLLGAPRLVRNLTLEGRRKLPGKDEYVEITPERVDLDDVLEDLDASREGLVTAAILMGSDFNDGVDGIGPNRGIRIAREAPDLEAALEEAGSDLDLARAEAIRDLFLEPEVTDDYDLAWDPVDEEDVVAFLHGRHDFSEDRVRSTFEKYDALQDHMQQESLDSFL